MNPDLWNTLLSGIIKVGEAKLEPGDVIIMSSTIEPGSGLLSSAAQKAWMDVSPVMQGKLVHSAIAVGDGKIMQVDPAHGIRALPFEEVVKGKQYVVRRPDLPKAVRQRAAAWAVQQEGKKYSFSDVALQIFGTLRGHQKAQELEKTLALPRDRDGYTCASIVTAAYHKAQITGDNQPHERAVSPADLHFSDRMKTIIDKTQDGPRRPLYGRLQKTANARLAQPGDVIAMSGNIHDIPKPGMAGFGDRLWNKYSPKVLGDTTHTGIVSPDGKHIIHVTPKDGVVKQPFHEVVHGRTYRIRRPTIDKHIRRQAATWAEQKVKEKAVYGWNDWVGATAGSMLGTHGAHALEAARDLPRDRKGYTCTTLVTGAYGKHLGHLGASATPADMHYTNKLKTIFDNHPGTGKPVAGRLKLLAEGVHDATPQLVHDAQILGKRLGAHARRAAKVAPPVAAGLGLAGVGALGTAAAHHMAASNAGG